MPSIAFSKKEVIDNTTTLSNVALHLHFVERSIQRELYDVSLQVITTDGFKEYIEKLNEIASKKTNGQVRYNYFSNIAGREQMIITIDEKLISKCNKIIDHNMSEIAMIVNGLAGLYLTLTSFQKMFVKSIDKMLKQFKDAVNGEDKKD